VASVYSRGVDVIFFRFALGIQLILTAQIRVAPFDRCTTTHHSDISSNCALCTLEPDQQTNNIPYSQTTMTEPAPQETHPPRRDSRHHHPNHIVHQHPAGLPLIQGFNLWHRKWSNLAYAGFILFCNLALPCILFYVLKDNTHMTLRELIGISSATLGVSSSFDGPFRTWKRELG
jgi:hypothetical protein